MSAPFAALLKEMLDRRSDPYDAAPQLLGALG